MGAGGGGCGTDCVRVRMCGQDATRTELEKTAKMAAVVVDQMLSTGSDATFDLSTVESEGVRVHPHARCWTAVAAAAVAHRVCRV